MFGIFQPFKLWVDRPAAGEISTAICVIDGWFAWRRGKQRPELRINNTALSWVPVKRPDVKRAQRWRLTQGFRAVLDASSFPVSALNSDRRIDIQLWNVDKIAAHWELRLNDGAIREGRLAEAHRESKRDWLKAHVTCPLCPAGTGALEFSGSCVRCIRCGGEYPDNGIVFDFLPQDLRNRFRIEDADDVSAHHYDEVALEIVEDVRGRGGKVLDCGSGMRPRVDEAVICIDVAPLPSVDVLAVNQKLPFKNAAFDAVLSLNVLEHVTDPFACAAELVRVLKPGGALYCCIPFLQPEHGYPHHYFNATRSGLRQLFPKELEIVEHVVPRSGEPIWSLRWFLSWYLEHLPADERRRFRQLRLKDVLEAKESSLLDQGWVERLSEEGKWKLASTTAAVFRKPASR